MSCRDKKGNFIPIPQCTGKKAIHKPKQFNKKNTCKIIDFSKPKHYKDKEWVALEEKEKECMGKIEKFCSAEGSCSEVKNKRLYENGQKVYKWKGWGIGTGSIYYEAGKGKYKKSLGYLDEVRMKDKKKMLKHFIVEDRTKFHRRK